jgi:hypothetical protein
MVRLIHILVVAAALSGAWPVHGIAQQADVPAKPVADAAGAAEPNPVPGLPRPPEQPASLLRTAPAAPAYACPDWECPYFERDALLDPAGLPQPGWLWDVELDVLGSHVKETLGAFTPPAPSVPTVPMARLDWAASPRFELGYRLPSGFGELDVAYRFLLTEGTGSTPAGAPASPDAAAALRSRLQIHVGDVDYASRETSLGPAWDMKWRIGLRTANVFFDSRADEPVAAAAGGVFERSISNNFLGVGPHATLELGKRRNAWGLGWVGRLDGALLFGEVHQKFAQVSTTAGAGDLLDLEDHVQVPILSGFLGLDWRPPCHPNLAILLGYTGEYWWNVGRLSDPDLYNGHTAGEVGLNGVLLRVEYNY